MIEKIIGRSHPSDADLLLFADREGTPRQMAKVRDHLAQCAHCAKRMARLENTLSDFLSLHEETIQAQPLASANARASLRNRLAEAERPASSWSSRAMLVRQFAGACAALV